MNLPIPMYDRILVRRKEIEEKTAGGIIMPDKVVQQRQFQQKEGEIIAVGEGYRLSDGSVSKLHVKVGYTIYFPAHAGVDIKVGDEVLVLMREEEILGIKQ